MKIYTRHGDGGETSLVGGKRVPKDSLRIEAYGTVDELNSIIGVCRSFKPPHQVDTVLEKIQNDLFDLGADLATPADTQSPRAERIGESHTAQLEKYIDDFDQSLEPLRSFILPGGDQSGAILHLARAVCRRAERLIVRLKHSENIENRLVVYINRLSDLLFVLARKVNSLSKVPETKWKS